MGVGRGKTCIFGPNGLPGSKQGATCGTQACLDKVSAGSVQRHCVAMG